MSERAISEVFETRHYAVSHTLAACGSTRVGQFTTCKEHVNCGWCLKAMSRPLDQPGPTVGQSAIQELATLRERIKALADDFERVSETDGPHWDRAAEDLRKLLDSP